MMKGIEKGVDLSSDLTERDRRVLELVGRFSVASRDQLMAAVPFGSVTRANTRLKYLVDRKFLKRLYLPIRPGHGGAPAIYAIGRRAGQEAARVHRWSTGQLAHA